MRVKKGIWIVIIALGTVILYQTVLGFIPPDFKIPAGYMIEQVLAPLIPKPLAIAVNSSGEIFLTGHDAGEVYQLHEDGSVSGSIYTVGTHHTAMDFDAQDNLFLVSDLGLWKIEPNGTATLVAADVVAYQLAVSPSGDIFTTGPGTSDVRRITPEGQVSVYASGMWSANDVDVNPLTGEVYIADWDTGDILRANGDGSATVITSGASGGHFIALSPTGQLYVSYEGTLGLVDIEQGTWSFLPWLVPGQSDNCALTVGIFEFDNQGTAIVADYTSGDVISLDLAAETIEVFVQGIVNPPAMAVAPNDGGVHIGVASLLCSAHGKILRIEEEGSPSVVVDDLPSSVNSITFDSDELGYASSGGQIYTFTSEGITNTLIADRIGPQDLGVNPVTGVLWGAGLNYIWYVDEGGELVTIPYPFEQTTFPDIAFTPDGTLYIYACEDHDPDPPEPSIYRFDPTDSSFTVLLDMTGTPYGCVVGSMTGAIDGNLYWLIGDLLRINPSGEATVFAVIPGGDPNSLETGPDSTDLYFGNGAGIFRIFEANTIYLPLVVRD